MSESEFELALLAGYSGPEIIFNGPSKSRSSIAKALRVGACINVDSLEELAIVADSIDFAEHQPVIGIRCFLGDDLTPQSRFGIDLNVAENSAALRKAASRGVSITGVHCHFPGNRSPEQYTERLRRLLHVVDSHLDSSALRLVDVGGGMAGPMSTQLRARTGLPGWDYSDYAQAIGGEASVLFGDDGPLLVLEPGTALIAHVGWYVAGVIARKTVGQREVAITDGTSLDLNPFRTGFQLPIHVVKETGAARSPARKVDIVGSSCMEDDVICGGYLGDLRVGDHILVENCGAYSMSLSTNFINGFPAVVALQEDQSIGGTLRATATPQAIFELQGGCL